MKNRVNFDTNPRLRKAFLVRRPAQLLPVTIIIWLNGFVPSAGLLTNPFFLFILFRLLCAKVGGQKEKKMNEESEEKKWIDTEQSVYK